MATHLDQEQKEMWLSIEYHNYSLKKALVSTKSMIDWPCIRAIQEARSRQITQNIDSNLNVIQKYW